MMFGIAV